MLSRGKLISNLQSLTSVRAFTLTEVIVVVGVITLLLTVGVGYTQKGGKQIVLFREHAQFTQQILRARSFATQKLRPEDELICGYGIHIADKNEYMLFKDLPGGVCPGNGAIDFGNNEDLETFSLVEGVELVDWSHAEFVFSPRDGFVYFGSEKARPGEEATITLELKSTNQRLTIHVNYLGQVYTE